jgi:eukaryotic-like serine/threonine-protein kinase
MELPVAVGEVVAQKYRIDRVIGQGGMGVVVAGYHLELDQPVAIKFLLSESGLRAEGVERFRREARAAAKIHSEHVARVFDVGLLDERVPYMVMELLTGNDLEQELEQRRSLPYGEAVGYVLQAIDAVAEAHSVGIVHRDLKPTNLFLAQRSDGSRIIKVLDFGISKSLGAGRLREVALTRTAAFVGSPLYMSPEQMRSARDVDPRTDVWSLGAILYVMLTGQLPHPGDSLPEVCVAVMNMPPRPLKDFLPDAPEELEAILMKSLAKEPALRYASVAEFAGQLLPFAPEWHLVVERATRLLGGMPYSTGNSAVARSSNPPAGSTPPPLQVSAPHMNQASSPPGATEAPWSRTGRKGGKGRRVPVIIASLAFLAIGIGFALAWSRSDGTGPVAAGSRSTVEGSAPSAELVPAGSASPQQPEAQAALPTASSAVNVNPVLSGSSLPAPRVQPPVAEQVAAPAATPRYTDFGGRR